MGMRREVSHRRFTKAYLCNARTVAEWRKASYPRDPRATPTEGLETSSPDGPRAAGMARARESGSREDRVLPSHADPRVRLGRLDLI